VKTLCDCCVLLETWLALSLSARCGTHIAGRLDITRGLPDCPADSLGIDTSADLLLVLDPRTEG
jgi:hypothetical protein